MKNFREIIALFVIAGLTGAYVLWVWGVPWNLIWIIIPWLAIPGIVSITFTVGKKRTAWFKDAEAHENFRNDLWRRAVPDNGNPTYQTSADRAVAHADRLVDRQINKVRGILPFNSIIMTVLGLERYRLSPHLLSVNPWGEIIYWLPTSAFLIVLILLGMSSMYCLELFRVNWNKNPGYGNFRDEFNSTVNLFNARCVSVTWAIVLSEASLFVGLCLVMMSEGALWASN